MAITAAMLMGILLAGTAQAQNGSNFGNTCSLAWQGTQDPIIEPSHGHLHIGYGATSVTNDDNGASLRGTPTNCNRVDNSSAYWHPAVYSNGEQLPVYTDKNLGDNTIYYRAGGISDANLSSMTPFPAGLELIARAGGPGSVKWGCKGAKGLSNAPPSTCESKLLTERITFGQCWDKVWVPDSDNQPENVVGASNGKCPKGYRTMPMITMSIAYELPSTTVGAIKIAGDDALLPHTSAHADFVNGWQQPALKNLVTQCIENVSNSATTADKPAVCQDPAKSG